MKPLHLTILIFAGIFLAACNLSLAGDVTPPPGYQPPAEQPVAEASVSPAEATLPATSAPSGGETTPYPGAESPTLAAANSPLTSTAALSPTIGTVSGVVMNASGGTIPGGVQVMLHAFDNMTMAYTDTVKLQDNGSFAFSNVELQTGRSFLATLTYNGVVYGSQVVAAQKGDKSVDLPIQIYDTTTDLSQLSVDRLHYFFEFIDDNTLRVVELYVISNNGKQTIVGPKEGQPVITFQLPPEAKNLQFQDGELGGRYLATKDGFGDTTPIRPGAGNYQVMYTYELPYDGKLELKRPISMPTSAVVVLAPEGGVQVKSEALQDAGARDVQGTSYHMYSGNSLKKGSELDMTVTGKPSSNPPVLTASTRDGMLFGAAMLGIVLLIAGVWLYQRTRKAEPARAVVGAGAPAENAETVMDAILALDDLYQDGQLPEEAYLKRRAELKARLKQLMG